MKSICTLCALSSAIAYFFFVFVRFELRDRVADRFFVKRIEHRIRAVRHGKRFNQTQRPGNAADRLVGMITGWTGDCASSIRRPRQGQARTAAGILSDPSNLPRLPAITLRLPLAQVSLGCHLPLRSRAEVAQLVEQLIRNQQVTGSSPVFGSLLNRSFSPLCKSLLGHFGTFREHPSER